MITIDWHVAATIASPIIALFGGIWIDRRRRPVLITYYGHVSAFKQTSAWGQPIQSTHTRL